jgi:hypothetical protein
MQTWQLTDAFQMRLEDNSPAFLQSRASGQLLIQCSTQREFKAANSTESIYAVFPPNPINLRSHSRLRHQDHKGGTELGMRHDTAVLLQMEHTGTTNRSGLGILTNNLDNILRL